MPTTALPLAGRRFALPGHGAAADYAAALLRALGATTVAAPGPAAIHPARRWADSGLLALTGHPDAPRCCPLPLPACADGVLLALAALAPNKLPAHFGGAELLGERAACAGFTRNGATSAGGSCRLLPAADGWLAANLARPDDLASAPAWLECDADDWDQVAAAVARLPLATLVERGRLLGLAVAAAAPPGPTPPWVRVQAHGASGPRPFRPPRVVDLSALWAGPLCGHLLGQLGAEVIKVESRQRPDGARQGPAAFYDLLNAGKRSVALDFASAEGRAQLRALLESADIVIEAARPRALRQLGIDAEALVAARPGLTWISLTGYGRAEPEAGWVAFGDDAGVAAGLTALMQEATGATLFCGDAIADPLTGLHAALAGWASWLAGGGRLLALALRDVVAHGIGFGLAGIEAGGLRARQAEWEQELRDAPCQPPRARVAAGPAQPLGADTAAVLAELGLPC